MTVPEIDPDYDLTLQRVIRASPSDIWRAGTEDDETPAIRAHHQELGFFDGWGSVTEALAGLVEKEAAA